MSLKVFNKTNAHYWDKKKTDWAVQDKEGHWWIVPGSETSEDKLSKDRGMNIPTKKRIGQSSLRVTPERMILIIVSSLLTMSIALNVVYYILR